MTHMAPELLLEGRASKASDVYAFGILLAGLATAAPPYEGVAPALLPHLVVKKKLRPEMPVFLPQVWERTGGQRGAAPGLVPHLVAKKKLRPAVSAFLPHVWEQRGGRRCGRRDWQRQERYRKGAAIPGS
eukprot:61227-Chlamydomonas_euryale.AAC.1